MSVYVSNGNPTGAGSVQALHDAVECIDGDIIEIPAGTFTWTTGVTINKGIHLRGAGSGGIEARSTTSITLGTGSKTFTIESGKSFTAGQAVRAIVNKHNPVSTSSMEGTVTSYSGTSLVLDITSVTGSGTFGVWAFRIAPTTEIVNNDTVSSTYTLVINEDVSHASELSGIAFTDNQVGALNKRFLKLNGDTGKPILVHHCYFSTNNFVERAVDIVTKHGIIYACSFDSMFGQDDSAIGFLSADDTSWSTASTMGADDITGENNFYVEDCRFAAVYLQAFDFDGNSRAVVRYNVFDNSGGTSHGSDTGPDGMRHFEVYNNTWHFENQGSNTVNMDYAIMIRSGTGVITDNVIPDINSSEWGDKAEIKFVLFNIRQAPQTPGGCQTVYPAFRQHGQSHNGAAYFTDPIRIWNNTGGLNQSPVMNDVTPDTCGNGLTTADFVVLDRDYTIGMAKPGYVKYTYPHPLRTDAAEFSGSFPNPVTFPVTYTFPATVTFTVQYSFPD